MLVKPYNGKCLTSGLKNGSASPLLEAGVLRSVDSQLQSDVNVISCDLYFETFRATFAPTVM